MKALKNLLGVILSAIAIGIHHLAGHIPLSNTIVAGRYPAGQKSLTASAALTKFYLIKFGSTEVTCDVCTSSDVAIGIVRGAWDSGDLATVSLFGAAGGTEIGIADAAIAKGAWLVAGSTTAGRIKTLPATTGTYYIIGRALIAAAAAGDEFEFVPCVPYAIAVA